MVHRDLKPENIFIDNDKTVILLDFGLAREITSSYAGQSIVGTSNYQGPEFHDVEAKLIGCKADIWSLGCVLFYLLTGKHAFLGSEKEVRKKILSGFQGKIDE